MAHHQVALPKNISTEKHKTSNLFAFCKKKIFTAEKSLIIC